MFIWCGCWIAIAIAARVHLWEKARVEKTKQNRKMFFFLESGFFFFFFFTFFLFDLDFALGQPAIRHPRQRSPSLRLTIRNE